MKNIFAQTESGGGLTHAQMRGALADALAGARAARGPVRKALILPPDITRANSYAGPICAMLYELLPGIHIDVMPALGTHIPMTDGEIGAMYPGLPKERFIAHNWRADVELIGEVPAAYVSEVSEGLMDAPVPVEVNWRLLDKSYDLILSVGQVVPHEVAGMANYNKNIFVGCGGSRMINASHFLGALYGMERIMGRDMSPVHKVFDYAERHFAMDIPLMYILTVTTAGAGGAHAHSPTASDSVHAHSHAAVEGAHAHSPTASDSVRVHSLAAGRDREIYAKSIESSQKHNLNFLDSPLKKAVVYLSPNEFHTTWIGNKAVYRTRMAMADGGELLIIAPGVRRFGEDLTNDALIRKYGYAGRDKVLAYARDNKDLADNLGVAAHLIHGSSDGRFSITYATQHISKDEMESAGFGYMPLDEALSRYDVSALKNGFNTVNGEEIFFIDNPALGLWALKSKFI